MSKATVLEVRGEKKKLNVVSRIKMLNKISTKTFYTHRPFVN